MRNVSSFPKVYLYRGHVDFRKWIQGLVVMVEHEFKLKPSENALFVFVSKDRRAMKCLYWNKTGFALWHTRLEKERFKMPGHKDEVIEISPKLMDLLLEGFNIFSTKPHEVLHFERFS